MNDIKELALMIARCSNFVEHKNECSGILSFQDLLGPRQLPEPWNGDLENAKYLFISSNPSYDPKETWPNTNDDDENIYSFFKNRFVGKEAKEIKKVAYWNAINKWVSWLESIYNGQNDIERIINNYEMNKNLIYLNKACITEIVHCKSRNEQGVNEVCKICTEKYLDSILSKFKGRCIVVVGKTAEKFFSMKNKVFMNKSDIVYCSHPSARGITDRKRLENIIIQIGLI